MNATALVELNQDSLPKLEGSVKQIRWAVDLRNKVIAEAIERNDDAVVETVETKTYAGWWIKKFKDGSRDDSKLKAIYDTMFGVKVVAVNDVPVDKQEVEHQPTATLAEDEKRGATNYGAVVIFHPGASREQIEAALRAINSVAYATVEAYNSDHGDPSFYIP